VTAWLPLHIDGVPVRLRAQPWIGWRAEPNREGKPRKRPYQIGFPLELASNNEDDEAVRAAIGTPRGSPENADPEVKHWRNEGDVREVQALAPELFDGFGIVLTVAAAITFIDLDDVRDPDTGIILAPWAIRLVEVFDSWTEISVSGTGVHIFARGRLPTGGLVNYLDGHPDQKLEVYSAGRFAYLTGQPVEPVRALDDRQELITRLAAHVRPPTPRGTSSLGPRPDAPIPAGRRNDALFRIARGFVLHGLRSEALERALLAVSHRRCVPVPPDADVVKIARHAERLPDRRMV
jgi:hypothetical protein